MMFEYNSSSEMPKRLSFRIWQRHNNHMPNWHVEILNDAIMAYVKLSLLHAIMAYVKLSLLHAIMAYVKLSLLHAIMAYILHLY